MFYLFPQLAHRIILSNSCTFRFVARMPWRAPATVSCAYTSTNFCRILNESTPRSLGCVESASLYHLVVECALPPLRRTWFCFTCSPRMLPFFFPCVFLKATLKSRESAPDQVAKEPQTKSRKRPRPCESTPDSDLNEAKLSPIRPSVLLVFRRTRAYREGYSGSRCPPLP